MTAAKKVSTRRMPSRHRDRRVELTLAELREFAGDKTQVLVSSASGIPQGEVSKIERRETLGPVSFDVLRRYVAAIGGELELVAVVGGRRVVIRDGK